MKIYKPRGITTGQLILVTTLGVISGVYIWKPLFEELYPRKRQLIQDETSDISLTNSTLSPELTNK